MSQERRSAWEGFVPKDAIVMRRRGQSQSSSESVENLTSGAPVCPRCGLSKARVISEGDPGSQIIFVCEASDQHENRPFVGQAAQLLDKMIVAMGLAREHVYICGIVKCNHPETHALSGGEIASYRALLEQQLAPIQPKVIVALGALVLQTLIGSENDLKDLRGRDLKFLGVPLIPTFHPDYLLQNPSAKREAWEDLKRAALYLGIKL